jgi:PAS domain S-box-containing protein
MTENGFDKLKYYLDNIPAPTHIVDTRYNIQYINKSGADILNMAQDECVGRKCYNLFRTPHCRTENCRVCQAMEENKEVTAENVIDPSGINIPIQYTGVPLKNEKGEIIGAIEQIIDITELKKSIEDLNQQKSYLDNIPAPVHIVDKTYTIQYINKVGANVLGYSVDQCIGKKCYELYKTPHCRTSECRLRQAISEDRIASGENIVDPDSLNIPIQYTCIPVKNKKGEIIGGLEHVTDITELKKVVNEVSLQNWIQSGLGLLNEKMSGDQDIRILSNNVISTLVKYLKGMVGTFYTFNNESSVLELTGSYAFAKRKSLNDRIQIGEGLIGQAAVEKELISITDLPEGYLRIKSSLGDSNSANVVVIPFMFEGELLGVIEIGSFHEFTDKEMDFLKSATESVGVAINSSIQRVKLKQLLEETQAQSEELQTQQEELKAANEELEEKTNVLQKSEEKLKAQQEELEASNEELEEKNDYLEKQKAEIVQKNELIDAARRDLEQKAKELEITSKYKSEFLANMSHELRTPLNSLLILSNKLAENKKGNLDVKQVESSKIIYKSGQDLLSLINDVLDISKIEAGKMNVNITSVDIYEFKTSIIKNFEHVAEQKKIKLDIDIVANCPTTVFTDPQRVDQVMKNLLSNAIKFTHKGIISVSFFKPEKSTDLSRSGLKVDDAFGISVKDTGIGIHKNKQLEIFEAFQQADGSTSRKYGGTGLGLSITRQIVKLLGGEITLSSEENNGSIFTVYLPVNSKTEIAVPGLAELSLPKKKVEVEADKKQIENIALKNGKATNFDDDRNKLQKGQRLMLVIEDDPIFAGIIYDKCHDRGFQAIVANSGEDGLALAVKYKPDAVVLDIMLPGIDGWAVLDTIKSDTSLRHIPVHMISGIDQDLSPLQKGAIGFNRKPMAEESFKDIFQKMEDVINIDIKKIILIEDDKVLRMTVKKLLKEDGVEIDEAPTGKEALGKIDKNQYDCMILDLGLPDMSGFELLDKIEKMTNIPPTIVYTGKELEPEQIKILEKYSNSIIIKGVKSEERLVDEVALFMHQVVKNMAEDKRKTIINLHEKDNVFVDKTVLIVDDDMRNVFALSGLFEEKGMKVVEAENGQEALKKLKGTPDVDIIIMDIMMPVMDGHEAMNKIRKINKYRKIPIIALTAKAMPEDRSKCIESGASDYLSKPVKEERLFSMMRAWLYR